MVSPIIEVAHAYFGELPCVVGESGKRRVWALCGGLASTLAFSPFYDNPFCNSCKFRVIEK